MSHIFLTGEPGSGKSTIIEHLMAKTSHKQGFYTKEILENGQRTGFELVTASNHKILLASTHMDKGLVVGKYRVNTLAIQESLDYVTHFNKYDVLFLDEIGQMQLASPSFESLVSLYAHTPNLLIATVSLVYQHPLIQAINSLPHANRFKITPQNREEQLQRLLSLLPKQ